MKVCAKLLIPIGGTLSSVMEKRPIHRSYSATRASSLIDFRLLKEEWFTVEHTFQRAEK